jgi:hypothetical protein
LREAPNKSFNAMLLQVVVKAPSGTTIEIGSIKDIPLYNADIDAAQPAAVVELKDKVAAADGLLLVCPRYTTDSRGVQERDRLMRRRLRISPCLRRPPGRGHSPRPALAARR